MSKKAKSNDGKAALEEILALDLAKYKVHLALASLTGEDIPDFQRVVITTDVAAEFRGIAERALKRLRSSADSEDLVLRAYEPLTLLDKHEIEHVDLAETDAVAKQIKALGNKPYQLDTFDQDGGFVAKLRFYVVTLKPKSGDPILFFRLYSRKKELGRSPYFGITMKKGQFSKVSESTLLFDQHVDCLASGNDLFILSKDKFQKIFQFYEELKKSAAKVLSVIQKHIPIDDFASFSKACEGHLLKLAKLKNIASKSYLNILKMSDIKNVIKKYNLPIKTVGKGKKERIHYDSSDKWGILRLLDDDYLESEMTKLKYEVNSKRSL